VEKRWNFTFPSCRKRKLPMLVPKALYYVYVLSNDIKQHILLSQKSSVLILLITTNASLKFLNFHLHIMKKRFQTCPCEAIFAVIPYRSSCYFWHFPTCIIYTRRKGFKFTPQVYWRGSSPKNELGLVFNRRKAELTLADKMILIVWVS